MKKMEENDLIYKRQRIRELKEEAGEYKPQPWDKEWE